jgi:phage gpG-like protein
MIDIQITGTLPQVNYDLSSYMQKVEEIMLASVQLNLTMGGRPPFNVKHTNETPLVGTGKMYKGLRSTSDESSATVYMDSSVLSKPSKSYPQGYFYPQALNDGAEVRAVESSEGKLMVFEIDGMTVFTRRRKGFHLGPFPFMVFQQSDVENIMALLPNAIFSQSGETIVAV